MAHLTPRDVIRAALPALLAVLAGLVTAGCGTQGPTSFDTRAVARTFQHVTGDRLVTDAGAGTGGVTALTLDRGTSDSTLLDERYGTFTVFVIDHGSADALYRQDLAGMPIRPGRDGIYWRRLGGTPASWQASKRYRNVILQWLAGPAQRIDARWLRLDAALTALVAPGRRAAPPIEDRPCAARGVDLVGGRGAATCRVGQQTVVVVDRGRRLSLPVADITRVQVTLRRSFRVASLHQTLRPRGRFVDLSFRVTNRHAVPLERVTSTLAIGADRYAPAGEAQLLAIGPHAAFPIQPGTGATLHTLYDVPVAAARRARRTGALLIAGDEAATLDSAYVVGRVRLR